MNIRAKIFGAPEPEEPILKAKAPRQSAKSGLGSVPVAREEQRTTDGRADDRHRLLGETVSVSQDGRICEVELINLSGGGAMVAGELAAKLWDKVELHLGENGTIDCAVRWIRDDRIGLEFAHETRIDCGADEQAAILREVVRKSFPDLEFEASDQQAEAHDGDESRAARRHPLVWSGLLHHDYQSTPVRLRNISASGAMIECSAPLCVGSEPVLELGDTLTLSATVAWVVGDQAGLRFGSPFNLHELSRSRPDVAPADWQPPSYLGNGVSGDSAWNEQWGRVSLGTLRQELEGFLKR